MGCSRVMTHSLCYTHEALTSLAPHERLPEILEQILMHDTGCLGLVHWDDPEGWYGEGGGRRGQDGEGSQEGCQGPFRPSGRNRGLPLSHCYF